MADQQRKLEQAARAAWLAHVGGLTQDEIAARMGVSRQSAQRLVAQAMSEGLVKIRIDHPFADCMQIASDLCARWNLSFCEIAPADAPADGVSHQLAAVMEQWLRRTKPLTLAVGTGRTLRAAIARLPHIDCPQHRIVSLTGNIATDGSTAAYNVLFSLSDLVTARSFPLPVSVVLPEGDTRAALLAQQGITRVIEMSSEAEVAFVGVGRMDDAAALLADGFVDESDLARLREAGALGEILGWAYDAQGRLIEGLSNDRVASAPIPPRDSTLVIGAAHGRAKLPAIRAALRGGLINGLVTDADTGAALLDQDRAAG
ncbi:sugar-binding transcriptional regulator [Paracoccus sp. 1_MG-2023]|uniref:sugar-binding transcriptional regulator n=1 Tax=unclassified Paracoccus (in: a-proteobacteria) TaxID=2688777 RepID=UPI001C09528B|nr:MULTISPECIES: sugar-binding transcriptional regulator [unclassified Paracoccus (in: a-proteobacteria)]MBU2958324.1 sugar-binding transcriptional regulator [Paracoccus sp. C2R09]MDO6668451.1 sugar-binding transcriptional regulator [Paracoccus sp. 1_MG-2023]